MRKRIPLLVLALVALGILRFCGVWLTPDPNTVALDLPATARKRERDTVCGSGSCTEYYDVTVAMRMSELTQFYQDRGYGCAERTRNRTTTPRRISCRCPTGNVPSNFPMGIRRFGFDKNRNRRAFAVSHGVVGLLSSNRSDTFRIVERGPSMQRLNFWTDTCRLVGTLNRGHR